MINQDELENLADDFIREPIVITAADHAEKLICRLCGKEYVSSGKHDPGICRNCRREQDAILVGGPLGGQKAHE